MNFTTSLKGNLEFVFKHSNHNIRFCGEVADLLDKLRSSRKEYCKSITKISQEFQKKLEDDALYGTTKEAVCQLLTSVLEEADGQMKTVEVLTNSIEEFKNKTKEIEKAAKGVRQDAETRTKDVEKCKDATKKEKDKFVKCHKDVTSMLSDIEKSKTANAPEKKIKSLEEKRDHLKEKEEEQNKVYVTSVETTNKRIKHFFDVDQIEILELYNKFEVNYLEQMKEILKNFSESLASIPVIVKESMEKYNDKASHINSSEDVVTFCKIHKTSCRTPTYVPVIDADGLIIKQEGALNERRNDDPEGMERVFLTCTVVHDFIAEGPEEMNVKKGDTIIVSEKHENGWWYATNKENATVGFVPETFVKDVN
ncbi:hypothetical protein EIN_064260 [Entamoeba invadens IP1]|uniref:SH3 domain-containing protein n=2 Tax=Entamoeba invadens TaxID=33085 RepID=A0A0A1TV83_ENTIV|nr:hypothetical protein EIN_064260 [Entamoeba invadens IP1]ELP84211.1 hypothetical protein EIN_064260 [Entamoeba invadens IP1]BAN41498.1 hypothetical protein [Entamoeba invadens]|eukprot:XP_004183557.1 hypothetical protein EIN_064260 [Entamoeba invadens IP1]